MKAAPAEAKIRLNEALSRCVRCGFCNATCPTYLLTGQELEGPRGRIQLIQAAVDGAPLTDKTRRHLDSCLHCLGCETTCPSGVAYRDIIDQGRQWVEAVVPRTGLERIVRGLLVRLIGWPWGLRWGFWWGRRFRRFLPRNLQSYLRTPHSAVGPPSRAPATGRTYLLLEGCVQRPLMPAIDAALIELIHSLGDRVERLHPFSCCGAAAHHLGETQVAERQWASALKAIRHRLEKREAPPVAALILSSSGCGFYLRSPGMGAFTREQAPPPPILDPLEILEPHLATLRERLDRAGGFSGRLVVHEPCSLQRGGLGEGRLTRFLEGLGIEVVRDRESSLCCGAGGTHALFQPQVADPLRVRKRSALRLTEGERAVSSNIGCLLHLDESGEICHWLCALAEALRTSSGTPPRASLESLTPPQGVAFLTKPWAG